MKSKNVVRYFHLLIMTRILQNTNSAVKRNTKLQVMQVAKMVAAAHEDAPRAPLHGGADEIERGGDEEDGPVPTKKSIADENK
jgi:hypothetical protein